MLEKIQSRVGLLELRLYLSPLVTGHFSCSEWAHTHSCLSLPVPHLFVLGWEVLFWRFNFFSFLCKVKFTVWPFSPPQAQPEIIQTCLAFQFVWPVVQNNCRFCRWTDATCTDVSCKITFFFPPFSPFNLFLYFNSLTVLQKAFCQCNCVKSTAESTLGVAAVGLQVH